MTLYFRYPQVRAIISDFAVIIAIFSMSALDYFVGIATPKLEVPHEFKPTLDGRGWLIMPFNENPWWSAIIAAAPALLGTILIFMDQQITAVIVNRKENKLKVSQLENIKKFGGLVRKKLNELNDCWRLVFDTFDRVLIL